MYYQRDVFHVQGSNTLVTEKLFNVFNLHPRNFIEIYD